MTWEAAQEILEGNATYSAWEYAYIRDAICSTFEKGTQPYEYYRMKLYEISNKDEL